MTSPMTQKPGANAGKEARKTMDQIKAQLLKFESRLPDPIRQTLKGLGARWQAASRKTQWVVAGVGGSFVLYLVFA